MIEGALKLLLLSMLSFHLNPDLEGYKKVYVPTFFNTSEFQYNQSYDPLYSFYVLDPSSRRIYGSIHFVKVGDFALSQPRGPYGGFELDATIGESEFLDFVAFIHEELRKKKVKKVKVVEPPDLLIQNVSFDPTEALYDQGYLVAVADIDHYVKLDEEVGIRTIHQMERRNFRRALAKGYKWKLEAESSLPEVYSFIERCRSQNGLKVNINFDDLNRTFRKFPGTYRIFSIRHSGYLCAATITVEVSKKVLYNYLPASDKKFKTDSPMVFLLVSLYKYAKSLGYEVLDLGVSSINGQIQSGLAEFKERMGALFCEKRTLQKVL